MYYLIDTSIIANIRYLPSNGTTKLQFIKINKESKLDMHQIAGERREQSVINNFQSFISN